MERKNNSVDDKIDPNNNITLKNTGHMEEQHNDILVKNEYIKDPYNYRAIFFLKTVLISLVQKPNK